MSPIVAMLVLSIRVCIHIYCAHLFLVHSRESVLLFARPYVRSLEPFNNQ